MTHTKGPWRVRQDNDKIQVSQCGPYAKKICNILNGGLNPVDNITLTEANNNARLIAAAPELLEALETLVHKCLHTDGFMQKVDELFQAQQAIKKAKGE